MQKEIDLELNDLNQFYATENYTRLYGVLCTDGVNYIMENGYSWFVTDAIIKRKFNRRLLAEEFLLIKLKLLEKGQAVVQYDDGNGNILDKQFYCFTDAKREVTLFLCDNVLMLPAEY